MLAAERYETGRKTFFWYRVYCLVMAFLSLALAGIGAFFVLVPEVMPPRDRDQMFVMGIAYGVLGIVFFCLYAVAALLPPKPYNWIIGIVIIALGMTSCCTLPAAIPLLIFWVKPETQEFLGRKTSP